MENAELIKAAWAEADCKRFCEKYNDCHGCPMPHKESPSYQRMCVDFDEEVLPQLCDALEAAEKRIAELEQSKHELERLQAAIKVKGGDKHYPTEFAYLAVCKANEDKRVRIAELEEAQRWIPVSERKPNEWQDVIMYHGTYGVQMAKFHDNRFWVGDGFYLCVSAWLPLPQPPPKGE